MKAVLIGLIIVLSLLSQLPLLALLTWACLYLNYRLFWRENEPKVIFFGLFFFWLTISIKFIYADMYQLRYEALSFSPNIIRTTYYSLLGYIVFALSLHYATRKIEVASPTSIAGYISSYSVDRVILLYIGSFVITILFKGIVYLVPGLSQLVVAFLQLKFGLIFILLFFTYIKKEKKNVVFLLLAIEIVLSFFSIFSSFKDILITVLVSLTIFNLFSNRRHLISFIVIGAACVYMFLLWQAVKSQYRAFLTGGRKSQSIVVAQGDALKTLVNLFANAKVDEKVWFSAVERVSYIEFFSQATDNVPAKIPFEKGAIWRDNVLHIVQPRILFPNKKSIDDSEMVNRYCSQKVIGASEGTTFSLGFMAESYIDFGSVFMLVPLFLVGYLIGYLYRQIIKQSVNIIWGFAMVTPLWLYINCNGMAGTKILGGLIYYFLAFYLFKRYLMKPLNDYLLGQAAPVKAVLTV